MAKHKAASVLGGKSKSKGKKKHVHHMHIRRSANGGYIAENHHEPPEEVGEPTPPPEEHTYPDLEGLQGHVAEHMGPEAEQPEQAQAAAPQAAPAPAPQMA